MDAIGVAAIHDLRAVVPIGPTTASALTARGIVAPPPSEATYPAVIAMLASLRARACPDQARK
jgi:hypothetical protein